ncbi:MAG TPA: EAL domain-containing protein [Clostridia bacterium]|nr:EAL domain-containing protein [Clostridia bacterium]
MVTLRTKRISFKTTIMLCIVLLASVLVSALFGFLQTNELRESYYAQVADSADDINKDIFGAFARADAALAFASPEAVPDGTLHEVSAILFINDGEAKLLAHNAAVVNDIILTQKFESILQNTGSAVYRDIHVFENMVSQGYNSLAGPVYCSIKKTDSGYIVAVLSLETVFGGIKNNEFDDIRLFAPDYSYSVSSGDLVLSQSFYSGLDVSIKEKIRDNLAFTDELKIGSQKTIMHISQRNNGFGGIRVAVNRSPDLLDSLIRSQTTRFIIENVALCAIFSAAFVLLMLMLLRDEGDFQFLNIRNENYAVKVLPSGKIIWKNNNFDKKFDIDNIGQALSADGRKPAQALAALKPVILDLDDRNGDKHYLIMSVVRFGKTYRLIGSDMTEDIAAYKSLSHSDRYDSITDLQYEWVFVNRLADIISKGKGIKCALALLRLSNLTMLKVMMGEHLFRQTIMLYSGSLKREFAGLGELYVLKNGDFALLNTDENTINTLINKLPVIMERLRRPITLNDNNIQLDGKLGMIVLNSRDSNITVDSLISNAQRALEFAIEAQKQSHYVLYPTSFSVARTNFRADGVVKKMVENKELDAYFQPQYSLITNKIVGFEALCRIIGPKSAEINIGELISIAEQYGGMIDLGNYICDRAMSFAAEIQDKNIQVAVNVSPIQLMQAGFTASFVERLGRHNLKKGVFNIEITESAALYSFEEAVAKLNILRSSGIGIHIDDFGVAYSSMLHLKLLPATLIKIDKSLIDDIVDNAEARAIIKNIINLAKDMKLDVIAEGVETPEQVEILRSLNCDMIQGFVISRAVPREDAIKMLKEVNKDV